jgi:hypothetical protein
LDEADLLELRPVAFLAQESHFQASLARLLKVARCWNKHWGKGSLALGSLKSLRQTLRSPSLD